jgi:chromate transporter
MARERPFPLFFTILGLSAVSWGGLALMSQLERRYVQRKSLLTPEAFADLVAVAWTVPGPVAGNVAVQLGYVLCGSAGAWLAGLASVLPFLVVMAACAFAFQHSGAAVFGASHLAVRFSLVLASLIGVTFVRQAQSLLRTRTSQLLCVMSTALLWVFHTPAVFLGVLAGSFALGWLKAPDTATGGLSVLIRNGEKAFLLAMMGAIAAFVVLPGGPSLFSETARQAGAGLTLFGGGFSAIPVLKTLYPEGPGHLPTGTFAAALALTSICPGPLLNIVPFLGFVRDGLAGALLATAAIFVPTGVLAVLVQRWRGALRQSVRFEHALGHLRAATTGFLAETVLRLVPHVPVTASNLAIAVVAVAALWRWKAPAYAVYLGVFLISMFI